jgi:hypothetical protein
MKFLTIVLTLLISMSAYGQHRDRHHDANGMPYGGHNPPVGVTGYHCMYSVYGCSGAGGSTNYYGYRGHGHGHVHGPGCGHFHCGHGHANSRGGSVWYRNGSVGGTFFFSQSQGNGCGNHGGHMSRGGSVTVYDGNVGGDFYFNQSQ